MRIIRSAILATIKYMYRVSSLYSQVFLYSAKKQIHFLWPKVTKGCSDP